MATPIIIYDDACPMCQSYTQVFKQLGWSERRAFSSLDARLLDQLDVDRARHEIPLLDPDTGTVRYGLDTQIAVLGRGLPWLRPLLRRPLVKTLLTPLYQLITYNRRVIAGTRPPRTGFDCAPDYHPGWRMTYVALATGACALIGSLAPALVALLLTGLVGGLIISRDRLSLAGHLATLALGGTLLALVLPPFLVAVFVAADAFRRLR